MVAYLEGLSREVEREGVWRVVFFGQRTLTSARAFGEAAEGWRARGLEVAYPPQYSPHLNPVEGVWRQMKGFLIPRRATRVGLRRAVAAAMERLGEQNGHRVFKVQSLCMGT